MQITPEAAKDIARHSGATSFHTSDLSNPEINIKYGTYLLAERIEFYDGNVAAALASYNAGPGPVEEVGRRRTEGRRTSPIRKPAPTSNWCSNARRSTGKSTASELGYGGG